MSELVSLATGVTTGYTEERLARFDDLGHISELMVFLRWDDGTRPALTIDFAGPPDFTYRQFGELVYPDGSHMMILVPPDGTFRMERRWQWRSSGGPARLDQGDDEWRYQSDGSGTFSRKSEFVTLNDHGLETLDWAFTRHGVVTGNVEMYKLTIDDVTGSSTEIRTTIAEDQTRTVHTIVRTADGSLVSDSVVTTPTAPIVEPEPEEERRQRRREPEPAPEEKKQTHTSPERPSSGPQPNAARTWAAGGGFGDNGGVIALPRWIEPDQGGRPHPLCEFWTDYYVVTQDPDRPLYMGSRLNYVGEC